MNKSSSASANDVGCKNDALDAARAAYELQRCFINVVRDVRKREGITDISADYLVALLNMPLNEPILCSRLKHHDIYYGVNPSYFLKKMCDLGYLQRAPVSDGDRRNVNVSVTEKGRELILDFGEKVSKQIRTAFPQSEHSLQHFAENLRAINSALEATVRYI